MDNSFTEITIPTLVTPDKSQGLYNAPIEDTQLQVGNNRNISNTQFYALSFKITSGSTLGVPSNTLTDIVYTGLNGYQNKSFTELIYSGLGGGNEQTGTITKYTTMDSVYEKNTSGSQVSGKIVIPPGRICEVNSRFFTTTQTIRLSTVTGSKDFLFGNQTTNIDLTSTNPSCTFVSTSTTPLVLKIQWSSSTNLGGHIDERPIFGIFIKIY